MEFHLLWKMRFLRRTNVAVETNRAVNVKSEITLDQRMMGHRFQTGWL